MVKTSDLRGVLAKSCFALGSVWTVAGVLKLIFGVRITLLLFPPLDLDRVSPAPAIAIGLLLVFVGAWLERRAGSVAKQEAGGLPAEHRRPLLHTQRAAGQSPDATKEPTFFHRTPSA